METICKEIIEWIREWFKDKKGPAVLGFSGGKDSLICAALLKEALGSERVIGVMMPNGIQKDINDSIKGIETLGIQSMVVNIGPVYDTLKESIDTSSIKDSPDQWTSLFTTNTPARLRMVTLYGIAAQLGGFVCNTCNLSEDIVGWSTYGGDSFGDFAPIGNLTKTEVVALGDYLKLPKELVHKAPSDGMCGKTDEEGLGFTYEELDKTIRENFEGPNFERILNRYKKSVFKLQNIRLPKPNLNLPVNPVFNLH